MSIDYCVCEGIKNMSEIDQFALIYDVICEYEVHMDARFEDHPWLSSPAGIEIIKAIGLFHVHGHKEECLHRFATTYIPGLAIVDEDLSLPRVFHAESAQIRGIHGFSTDSISNPQ